MSPTCSDFKTSGTGAVAATGCGVRGPGRTDALDVGRERSALLDADGEDETAAGAAHPVTSIAMRRVAVAARGIDMIPRRLPRASQGLAKPAA